MYIYCTVFICLSGVPSLAEQCKAVIMSTLVELDSVWEAEQLSERLPDHIPPRIKHNLTSGFGLFTLTRPPPERLASCSPQQCPFPPSPLVHSPWRDPFASSSSPSSPSSASSSYSSSSAESTPSLSPSSKRRGSNKTKKITFSSPLSPSPPSSSSERPASRSIFSSSPSLSPSGSRTLSSPSQCKRHRSSKRTLSSSSSSSPSLPNSSERTQKKPKLCREVFISSSSSPSPSSSS